MALSLDRAWLHVIRDIYCFPIDVMSSSQTLISSQFQSDHLPAAQPAETCILIYMSWPTVQHHQQTSTQRGRLPMKNFFQQILSTHIRLSRDRLHSFLQSGPESAQMGYSRGTFLFQHICSASSCSYHGKKSSRRPICPFVISLAIQAANLN